MIATEGERMEQELSSAKVEAKETERLRGFIEVIAAVKQQYCNSSSKQQ